MGAYQFKAIDGTGKAHSGMVEAASAPAARQSLRAKGLTPIKLVACTPPTATGSAVRARTPRSPGLSAAALTLVTRQMATLLGSGLRIEDALATISSGQPSKVAAILLSVRATVLEGRSLSVAMASYPRAFSEYYRASVQAGEQSGKLAGVMAHLASHVEHRSRNRQSVQLALLYPLLLGFVSLAIIIMLMTFVVPDIVKVFRDRGADLPLLTRALIGLSDAIRSYGLAALVALGLLALLGARLLQSPQWRLRLHARLARFNLVRRMNAAQCAGTLATLLQSQVPLVDALTAATDVVSNLHLRASLQAATDKVRQGMSLHRALSEASTFPPMVIAMVASGEASGQLGRALDHAAAEQQRDLDAWVKAMVALVEPAILVIMGGLVMAMVLAILLPIVSLNGLANG